MLPVTPRGIHTTSGRRGSNPRPSAWEADALPTELLPRIDLPKSHRSELNRRPLDYESSALPLSYGGGPSSSLHRNGAEGSRTPDLLNAIQALSQLSYSPTIDCGRLGDWETGDWGENQPRAFPELQSPMPTTGLEPARHFWHWSLKPACLPVSARGQICSRGDSNPHGIAPTGS